MRHSTLRAIRVAVVLLGAATGAALLLRPPPSAPVVRVDSGVEAAPSDAPAEAAARRPLDDVRVVAVGLAETCVIRGDARVWCWGGGYEKGARLGDPIRVHPPGHVPELDGATMLSMGSMYCASNGAWVRCWGEIEADGESESERPVDIPMASPISEISAAMRHGCALTDSKRAFCWGRVDELSHRRNPREEHIPEPVHIAGTVRRLSHGIVESYAITDNGAAFRWGEIDNYREPRELPETAPIPPARGTRLPISGVKDIAATGHRACALKESGEVWCWRTWRSGRLLEVSQYRPERVPLPEGVLQIVAGHQFCARTKMKVYCWEQERPDADSGEEREARPVPHEIEPLAGGDVQTLAAGSTTCALLQNGTLKCWGDNMFGQLAGHDGGTEVPVTMMMP